MTLFPRSLRGRLTLSIVALTTVAVVLLGLATAVITWNAMRHTVDEALSNSIESLDRMVERSHDNQNDRPGHTPHPPKPFVEYTSQSSGTVIALLRDGALQDSAVFTDAGTMTVSNEVAAALEGREWVDGERLEIDLPGLGGFLATSRVNDRGETLISAVALDQERSASALAVLAILAVGAVTLAGAAAATVLIVRTATRPLARVSSTADHVSRLPLQRGAVEGGFPRLDERDTDERSETGRVGAAINRMLEHIDDAIVTRDATDRRMRQFVTDASHELRTPLAAIQGYAELTRQESDVLPPLTETSLARIEAEASRMSTLVTDLLLLARLDEGQGGLEAEPVDLCHVALTALHDARTVAPAHEWVDDLPAEPVFVRGDQAGLMQIVSNLLRNAHIHTPDGTRVTVRVRPDAHGSVDLSVADTGPGVEPEFRNRLFQRFARLDRSRSRRTGSTGLGLAIVAALAEAQGGSVRYEDAAPGARFVVTLPAAGTD